jgi:GMP synthase-like glutamine amidotransferase
VGVGLGTQIGSGIGPEVGVLAVELTEDGREDPVLGPLPPTIETLQWHGDTFDLPEGATLLAGSPAYRNQAFVYERAYALQFHLEVSRERAAEWGAVPAYAASLEAIQGPGALDRLVDEVGEHEGETVPLARELFGRWLELVVRVPVETVG